MEPASSDLDRLGHELRELAAVAVGLGVLGVQQAQVRRRDLERRAAPVVDRLRRRVAERVAPDGGG